jgi:hypothetical protein
MSHTYEMRYMIERKRGDDLLVVEPLEVKTDRKALAEAKEIAESLGLKDNEYVVFFHSPCGFQGVINH